MSLAEIEKQARQLPADERHQFVSWVYAHEDELIESPHDADISSEVMQELLRRRQELDAGDVKTYSLEEVQQSMRRAINEVRRPLH